jgi:peptidoglycan LD-endopeptidase LytH
MNRLQVVFLVLLLAFVTLMWLGTGRVPPPSLVESVPSMVQPVVQTVVQPVTEATAQVTQIKRLIIPVAGVKPDQLLDTFTASRSEGRTHDAIDNMAPAETPVLAAADGQIQNLFQSERGGTTIYQLSADRNLIFYYAHLARYADGLTEGKQVRQGEVIGYVGDTGNAGLGNYHLHFSIAMVSDPKRYWEGTNINPYPMLRGE